MRCDSIRELLSALADGETDAAETRRVEAHVADCPACRARLASYRALKGATAAAAPAELRAELLRMARNRPRSFLSRLRDWSLPLGLTAGAFAAGLLALSIWPREEPMPVDVLLQAHKEYAASVAVSGHD